MPGQSGLDVLRSLKTERVDSKVIVLTMHNDPELVTRAMRAGASGFLLKESAGEELLTAIRQRSTIAWSRTDVSSSRRARSSQ